MLWNGRRTIYFFKEKNIYYEREGERIYEMKNDCKKGPTVYFVANRRGRRKQFFEIQIGEESRCRN